MQAGKSAKNGDASPASLGRGRSRAWAWLVYGLCLAVFFFHVWQSEILSPVQRESMLFVTQTAKQVGIPMRALCDSAELYWNQYPDVAKDDFFGRSGQAGCGGAYEHWTRHGRQEGRVWPGSAP